MAGEGETKVGIGMNVLVSAMGNRPVVSGGLCCACAGVQCACCMHVCMQMHAACAPCSARRDLNHTV